MRKLFPIENSGDSLLPVGQGKVTQEDIECLQCQINTNSEDIDTLDNALQQKIAEDAQEVNTDSIIADTGNIGTLGATSITATGTITADTVDADTLCGSTANVSRVNASCIQSANATISDINATCVCTQNIDAANGNITDVCADNITSNTATLESATINCLTSPDLTLTDLTATNGNITNLTTGPINATGIICSTNNITGGNLFACNVVHAGNSVETPRINLNNNAGSFNVGPSRYIEAAIKNEGTFYIRVRGEGLNNFGYIIVNKTASTFSVQYGNIDGSGQPPIKDVYIKEDSYYSTIYIKVDHDYHRRASIVYGEIGVGGPNNGIEFSEVTIVSTDTLVRARPTTLNHDVYIKCLETYDLKSDCGCIDGFETNTLRVCEALITNEMDMQNGNIALTGNLTHSGEFTLENECGAYICSVPNQDTINISHTNQECIDFCCGTAHCCFTICGDQVVTQNLIVCEDLVVCGNTTIAGISADSITTAQATCTHDFYIPVAENNTVLPHSNPVATTPTATVSYNCANCESTLGITNICATGNINSDSACVTHCLNACEINACTVCGDDIIGADGCFTGNLTVDCCIVGNLCGIACKVKKTEDNDEECAQYAVWVDCDNNIRETSNVNIYPKCGCLVAPTLEGSHVIGACICGICCIETPVLKADGQEINGSIKVVDANNKCKVIIDCDGIKLHNTNLSYCEMLTMDSTTGNINTVNMTLRPVGNDCYDTIWLCGECGTIDALNGMSTRNFSIKNNNCDTVVSAGVDNCNGCISVYDCTGNANVVIEGVNGNISTVGRILATGCIKSCCCMEAPLIEAPLFTALDNNNCQNVLINGSSGRIQVCCNACATRSLGIFGAENNGCGGYIQLFSETTGKSTIEVYGSSGNIHQIGNNVTYSNKNANCCILAKIGQRALCTAGYFDICTCANGTTHHAAVSIYGTDCGGGAILLRDCNGTNTIIINGDTGKVETKNGFWTWAGNYEVPFIVCCGLYWMQSGSKKASLSVDPANGQLWFCSNDCDGCYCGRDIVARQRGSVAAGALAVWCCSGLLASSTTTNVNVCALAATGYLRLKDANNCTLVCIAKNDTLTFQDFCFVKNGTLKHGANIYVNTADSALQLKNIDTGCVGLRAVAKCDGSAFIKLCGCPTGCTHRDVVTIVSQPGRHGGEFQLYNADTGCIDAYLASTDNAPRFGLQKAGKIAIYMCADGCGGCVLIKDCAGCNTICMCGKTGVLQAKCICGVGTVNTDYLYAQCYIDARCIRSGTLRSCGCAKAGITYLSYGCMINGYWDTDTKECDAFNTFCIYLGSVGSANALTTMGKLVCNSNTYGAVSIQMTSATLITVKTAGTIAQCFHSGCTANVTSSGCILFLA